MPIATLHVESSTWFVTKSFKMNGLQWTAESSEELWQKLWNQKKSDNAFQWELSTGMNWQTTHTRTHGRNHRRCSDVLIPGC